MPSTSYVDYLLRAPGHTLLPHPLIFFQAYVLDYDIYLLEVSSSSLTAITNGGSEMGVVNGIPDWVYEGEPAHASVCKHTNILTLAANHVAELKN